MLSKIYKLIEDSDCDSDCENCRLEYLKLENYDSLVEKLNEYNYDYSPEEILINIKYDSNQEEALAEPKFPELLILTSDDTKIKYSDAQFIIKWFCENKAVIEVKDDKKYCKECFEKINKQLSYGVIKKILETKDEMNGLSTSQKIEYILVKNHGKKLSASEIYEIGEPWDLKTFTPRNSVYARASSLHQTGLIKRDGTLYYI